MYKAPDNQIIDLLGWMKTHGMCPNTIQKNDRYLCTITRRIHLGKNLKEHQKDRVYWIPSVKGLNQIGLKVEVEDLGNFTAMKSGPFYGAGHSESEAGLSLLNHVRQALNFCHDGLAHAA